MCLSKELVVTSDVVVIGSCYCVVAVIGGYYCVVVVIGGYYGCS